MAPVYGLAENAVAVTLPPPVGVTISPTTATVLTNGTQQFTATVTNASNTSVTWTATGGTVSSSGLYTAGATTGSFTVKATSVQDATKSASAAIKPGRCGRCVRWWRWATTGRTNCAIARWPKP